jgi:aldose 1-epimerase
MGKVLALLVIAAAVAPRAGGRKPIERRAFGETDHGQPIDLYTLRNARGVEVSIITYGGIVTAIKVPDRNGAIADVVLGFDSLAPYLKKHPLFGALVGRYANRIGGARFTLDGHEHRLTANEGPNHLHGGLRGFDRQVWRAEEIASKDGPTVRLSYTSRDGEEGYPGTLAVTVTYALIDGGGGGGGSALRVEYAATTDKPTIVNLTSHGYFNLAGQGQGDILGHELTIAAARITPVGEGLLPTGELRAVAGTPFDFRRPVAIGARIDARDRQLALATGYDHNFVLDPPVGVGGGGGGGGTPRLAARVREPRSGRVLEVLTTEPGLQLYSGNFLDGTLTGKAGRAYGRRQGLCLEPQHFPDSPHQPSFPSVVLRPGERYRSTTIYRFTTDRGRDRGN